MHTLYVYFTLSYCRLRLAHKNHVIGLVGLMRILWGVYSSYMAKIAHTPRHPLPATIPATIAQNRHNRPIVPSTRIPPPSMRPLSNPAAAVPVPFPSHAHAIPTPHLYRLTSYCPSPIIHPYPIPTTREEPPNAHAIHHWRLDSHLPRVRPQTKSTPPLPRERTNNRVPKRKMPRLQKFGT